MATFLGDISNMVFCRTSTAPKGHVSMSGEMLQLLMAVDGRSNLSTIASKLNLTLSGLRPLLSKLIEYGLIEEIPQEISVVGPHFLKFLTEALSKIAGPIAAIMVEDALAEIGVEPGWIPMNRTEDIIAVISRQIPDEKKRAGFQRTVRKFINEM